MLTGEFRAVCEQLKPLIKLARALSPQMAADKLKLHLRHETILLMPRQGGKTEIGGWSAFGQDTPICEHGGWLDEHPGMLDADLVRLITAMLKLKREQRATLPEYNPKIFLRPETWDRIVSRFHWLHPSNVAQIEFPKPIFYEAFFRSGATPDAMLHFPKEWLARCCDSSGRLLPGLAFEAMERTIDQHLAGLSANYATWRGYAEAAAEHLKSQPDLSYWLAYLAAGDKQVFMGGAKLSIAKDRALLRLRQARRAGQEKIMYGLSTPGFIRHCEAAGVWKRNSRGYLAYSTPYAIGSSFLKSSLTDAAFQRMLSE